MFPEEFQRHSKLKCFNEDRIWPNIMPGGTDLGVSVEVNFEAEIDKISFLCSGEERKVKE